MRQIRLNKSTIFVLILLSVGIVGSIFFFPVNIQNRYTCLYHRLFFQDGSFIQSQGRELPATGNMAGVSGSQSGETSQTLSADESQSAKTRELQQRYFSSFSYLWWGSLLLLILSIYGLKRLSPGKVHSPTQNQSTLRNGYNVYKNARSK